jgi:hypothetical protein
VSVGDAGYQATPHSPVPARKRIDWPEPLKP